MCLTAAVIAAVSVIIGFTIFQHNRSPESDTDRAPIISLKLYTRDSVDRVVENWAAGEMTYDEAERVLTRIRNTAGDSLTGYAEEQLAFLTREEQGNVSLAQAENSLRSGSFPEAFSALNSIDPAYTKYGAVLDLYAECKNAALESVASPTSEEEFNAFIRLLDDCNGLYPSEEFTVRKQELEAELVIFLDISETIEASAALFDNGQVEESFLLLTFGLVKYPDSDRLATTLVDFRDHYIISTTMQAVDLCEQEEYKQALHLVESAIAEYDCAEFQALKKAIREEKNFLYRWTNNIVDGFNAITSGWTAEEFDVQLAADNAEAYIIKSGRKLVLGDYTDEDVTILSFTGNVVASLLGADVLFDLRDLSYDITHWGEDEYFAIWLAADVVALLPLVGVVKYLSHFKTAANGVDAAAELVDSVADVGKNADNVADLVDTISDITRTGDNIADAIDNAKDLARTGEAAKDIAKYAAKGFTPIDTVNQKLLGSTHAQTGIRFAANAVEMSDGRKLIGVFPVFDSYADVRLPESLYKESFYKQQQECMSQLQKEIKFPWSRTRKNFTQDQLEDIANGILPDGFTWHHNEEEGLMQLVDTLIHDQTNHTGGMSIWGMGY